MSSSPGLESVADSVLLTCDASGTSCNATLWNPQTGTTLRTFKGGVSAPNTLSFLGDSFLISSQPTKPVLNVWPLHKHEQVSSKITTPGQVGSMAASPSGKFIVASIAEKIFVWQTCNGNLIRILDQGHYQAVTCLEFTGDGSHFISGGKDGNVLVWNLLEVLSRGVIPGQDHGQVDNPCPVYTFSDHKLPITGLHVTFGGARSRIITSSLDQTCKVFCLASGKLLLDILVASKLHSVSTDIKERNIFIGTEEGTILSASLKTAPRTIQIGKSEANLVSFVGHKAIVRCLSVSVDGQILASGCDDGVVKIWNIQSRVCIRNLSHKDKVTHVKFFLPINGILKAEHYRQSLFLAPLKKTVWNPDSDDCAIEFFSPKTEEPINYDIFDGDQLIGNRGDTVPSDDVIRLERCNQQLYNCLVDKIINKPS